MTRDINRFKKINKKSYITLIDEIKGQKQELKTLEHIFPLIHGLDISVDKEYNFKNIIEARDYLNNEECLNNIINICKYLLKDKNTNIVDILGSVNSEKLKSSITLFSYITNPNINSLLNFRNYNKTLITKIFTENKEFTIFKKILDKFFDGEFDKETILIIESEMLEYSLRDRTLKDINEHYKEKSESLLIKFSEISPLVTAFYKKRKEKKKIKAFYNSLTDEEYLLFLKFNIKDTYKKDARKYKYKLKEKSLTLSLLILTLLIGTSVNPIKESYSSTNNLISQISIDLIKEQNVANKGEVEEQIEPQAAVEPEPIVETVPSPVVTNYSYVTPSGSGNRRVVEIAASQIGNVGGAPYWSLYGFSIRVDWCGCFVSWVFNEAGLLGTAIPKFSIASDGLNWFINNKLFRDRNYVPRSGDLIFFDYNYDGRIEHVGIVDRVANGRVYTIEGNTNGDRCGQNSFTIGNSMIYGYGTPNY